MNKQLSNPAITGITRSTVAYFLQKCSTNSLPQDSHVRKSSQIQQGTKELVISSRKKRISVKVDSFAQGIIDHVRLAPKLTETLKGKLSLGARILQLGGVEKVFKKLFNVKSEGDQQEKLVKASQCYLSTTNGPIAGLLFISTHRIAFCSERSIKVVSPTGKLVRIYYKVSIPMKKITRANTGHDMKRPSQKYIEVVTEDKFEFWFMGFLNHRKTLQCVQQMVMISQAD